MQRFFRGFYAVACVVIALTIPAQAQSKLFSSLEISKVQVDALMQAYAGWSKQSDEHNAPLILKDYSVEIVQSTADMTISFFPNEGTRPATITLKDGSIVSRESSLPVLDAPPIVLPGTLAGAIIAAYTTAQKDRAFAVSASDFDVKVELLAGGAQVALIPRGVTHPGDRCLAGACDGRLVYIVSISSGKVSVVLSPLL
jgi:hypothetical protein